MIMNDVQLYTGNSPVLARDAKRAVRHVSAVRAGGQVRRARLDDETDFAVEAVNAIGDVHTSAMGVYVRFSQIRQQVEMQNPAAAPGLAIIDSGLVFGLLDETASFQRAVRRM
jgi:hypothetical protein